LIKGATDYAVPFEQWRPFPIGKAERRVLGRLELTNDYEQARKALARVLYQARVIWYFSIDKLTAKLSAKIGRNPSDLLKPMFAIQPRSPASIRRNIAERDEVFRVVYEKSRADPV
jgi:hypothetical protein